MFCTHSPPHHPILQGTWLPSVAVPVFVQLRVYLLPHRLSLLHSWHWCPVSMQWTGNASQPVPENAWALGIRSIMHAPCGHVSHLGACTRFRDAFRCLLLSRSASFTRPPPTPDLVRTLPCSTRGSSMLCPLCGSTMSRAAHRQQLALPF